MSEYGSEAAAYLSDPVALSNLSIGRSSDSFEEKWNKVRWNVNMMENYLPNFSGPSAEANMKAASHHLMSAMESFSDALSWLKKHIKMNKGEAKAVKSQETSFNEFKAKTRRIDGTVNPKSPEAPKAEHDFFRGSKLSYVFEFLRSGGTITSEEARRKFGAANLTCIIKCIENHGYKIEYTNDVGMNGRSVRRYSIVNPAKAD